MISTMKMETKYCLKRLNQYVIYDNGNIRFSQVPEGVELNKKDFYDLNDDAIKILRKLIKIQVNHEDVLKYTKEKISNAFSMEDVVKEYIKMYDDITKIKNIIGKRIKDFCEIYWPEIAFENIEKIILLLSQKRSSEMGIKVDKMPKGLMEMVERFKQMDVFAETLKQEIEQIMRSIAPNFTYLAMPLIAARLLNAAGSLKELALMPSSTIQILGAEKAMFRFLATKKGKPPKHGYIFAHPLVSNAKNKGKAARKLANKLALMIKTDLYGNEFIADKVYETLKEEFKRI